MTGSRRPALTLAIVGLLGLAVGLLGSAAVSGTSRAPRLADPAATGRELVTEFFDILVARDGARFLAFSSRAFQVARADGTGEGREAYAAKLPTIQSYSLEGISVEQGDGVLTVRYLSTVTGVTPQGKPYTPGAAPRLTVFVWDGMAWKLAAHGNFNSLEGPSPSPSPAS